MKNNNSQQAEKLEYEKKDTEIALKVAELSGEMNGEKRPEATRAQQILIELKNEYVKMIDLVVQAKKEGIIDSAEIEEAKTFIKDNVKSTSQLLKEMSQVAGAPRNRAMWVGQFGEQLNKIADEGLAKLG